MPAVRRPAVLRPAAAVPRPALHPWWLGLLLGACAQAGPGPAAPAARLSPATPVAPAAPAVAVAVAVAPPPAEAAGPAPAASAPAAAAPAPGQAPPFALAVRGATARPGLLTVWQREERHWLELKPADFDRVFFLSPKVATGLGEAGLYGGLMASTWGQALGRPQAVQFRKVGASVQLIALNTSRRAPAGSPGAAAVAAGYSPSLLGSAPLASQPHPQSRALLVDLGALFQGDMPGIALALQRAFRQPYAHDPRHGNLQAVRPLPGLLAFEVRHHYATAALAGLAGALPAGAPAPSLPDTLPDVRSLFITVHYSLQALPAEPMPARRADPRVGYFSTQVFELDEELSPSPKRRLINRWRLEKADPFAAVSPPRQPLVYWIDRSVPLRYRDSIRAGILEWNKAFAAIGIEGAIQVREQPAGADFDTLDADRASVRWMSNAEASFGAIGPSHVDPRTGEILDADIAFESLSSRSLRLLRSQVLPESFSSVVALGALSGHDPASCLHADHATEQLAYALDLLEARGELDPDGPEAEAFVQAYLKDVTMHEVGHTLGLRHNFRASRAYRAEQLADPAFTRQHALTGSVMEYAPVNLGPAGVQPRPEPFQSTLGPYDYLAIEYGYKPLAPEVEAGELQRLAARTAEPTLGYGTDEDNSLGLDPETLPFDLGEDVLAHARSRLGLARELLQRQAERPLRPDRDYTALRRSVNYALREVGRVAGTLVRQVGGLRTLRDYPGSGRDPLQVLPVAEQRAALELIAAHVFAADAFALPPALARRLAPDFDERLDALRRGQGVASDYSLAATVLDLQRAVLGPLFADSLATRLLDSEGKVDRPEEALKLSELHGRLVREIWSELAGAGDIPPLRRELQREHLNRLSVLLLRPGSASRADIRSLMRDEGQRLHQALARRLAGEGLSREARAHLQDCLDSLDAALKAPLLRAG